MQLGLSSCLTLLSFCVLFNNHVSCSELHVCGLFSDHMVLQDGVKNHIWGQAGKGEVVSLNIASHSWTCQADATGNWSSHIPVLKPNQNYTLTIKTSQQIQINNIVVGEVWVAGGQSNMQFRVALEQQRQAAIALSKQTADHIRFLKVPYRTAQEPLQDVNAKWSRIDETNVDAVSAVAFYYAALLQQKLQKPVGIIQCCIGGTVAETWMSNRALQHEKYAALHTGWDALLKEWYPGIDARKVYQEKCKQWPVEKDKAIAAGKPVPPWPSMPKGPDDKNRLSALYNGMLVGISPYTIKGCIWYQGESNAYRAMQYRDLLKDLIIDWRRHWGKDMPFFMVELCSYADVQKEPIDKHPYAVARESQRLVAKELAHCDLISSIDLYDKDNPKDIHPKNKRDVAQRLGHLALSSVYDIPLPYSGPRFKSYHIDGQRIIVDMTFADGMRSQDGAALKGFAIAGANQKWHWAEAEIKGNSILLSSTQVQEPVAAAYAWAGVPIGNLVNKDNLPAFAFRTDNWPRATQGAVNP